MTEEEQDAAAYVSVCQQLETAYREKAYMKLRLREILDEHYGPEWRFTREEPWRSLSDLV